MTNSIADFFDQDFGEQGLLHLHINATGLNYLPVIKATHTIDPSDFWVTYTGEYSEHIRFFYTRLDRHGEPAFPWKSDDFAPSRSSTCTDMIAMANGKIVVIGWAYDHEHQLRDIGIARYDRDGEPDRTFGVDGKKIISVTDLLPETKGVAFTLNGQPSLSTNKSDRNGEFSYNLKGALSSDEKILIAFSLFYSDSDSLSAAIRLDRRGEIDRTLGENGLATLSFTNLPWASNTFTAISSLPDGAFSMLATVPTDLEPINLVAKFSHTGKPDYSFNATSTLQINTTGIGFIHADGTHKFKLGGFDGSSAILYGLDARGFDETFKGESGVVMPIADVWEDCAVGLDPDMSRYTVVGREDANTHLVIARYLANADLDPNFNDGVIELATPIYHAICTGLADGRAIIGCHLRTQENTTSVVLYSLLADPLNLPGSI